jgi:alpha-aminoadipic semialdehyde synthase
MVISPVARSVVNPITRQGACALKPIVGVRREDKSIWERRVPITPEDAQELQAGHSLEIVVQTSDIRVFKDDEYLQAGIDVREDLSAASATFAVKEIPIDFYQSGKTYVFFAHVIKGQPYNMPMLKRMMDLGCNLIDYEKVTDDKGARLIFFGRHAGLAGMLDTLWAFGHRLAWEGSPNPFTQLKKTHQYEDLREAVTILESVKNQVKAEGLPESVTPCIVGIAGYGNVSRGAQEILSHLPIVEISPDELPTVAEGRDGSRHALYKVVFKEEHMVEPVSPDVRFELQDYYQHPEKYRSRFETYLPYLAILVNAIYWDAKYPRLVTKDYVKKAFGGGGPPRLKVIGDVTCDVEGAIEVTKKVTEPGAPVFVYDPETDEAIDGLEGRGLPIMAVDILPSELPRESSIDFSQVLKNYVPAIAKADFSVPFDQVNLPSEIKRAVILHKGQLTPEYRYIERYLSQLPKSEPHGGKQ